MQICTHTVLGRPNWFACWSNRCQAAELVSVHDCTTRPPVPYGPHMRVPPTATYPCATFSAIEQPMKPIERGPPVVGGRVVVVGGRLVVVGGRVVVVGGRLVVVGGRVVVVGATVPPVQTTPLSAKLDGAGLLLLFHEPLKP